MKTPYWCPSGWAKKRKLDLKASDRAERRDDNRKATRHWGKSFLFKISAIMSITISPHENLSKVKPFCCTSQLNKLKYVFWLEDNVSRVVGQNSLTSKQNQNFLTWNWQICCASWRQAETLDVPPDEVRIDKYCFSVSCKVRFRLLCSYYNCRIPWRRTISSTLFQWKTWHWTSFLWRKSSVIVEQMPWVILKCSTCMIQEELSLLRSKAVIYKLSFCHCFNLSRLLVNIFSPVNVDPLPRSNWNSEMFVLAEGRIPENPK